MTAVARQIPDWLNEVEKGWHPLLAQLHTDLVGVAPGYIAGQVKEKFGGLRVYLDAPLFDETVNATVSAAERASYEICEFCGGTGRPRRNGDRQYGWIKTVCEDCHVTRGAAARAYWANS